jgi:hypothetical protein
MVKVIRDEISGNSRLFWGAALAFLCAMTLIAELTGEREVLFPEAMALAVGAWIAPVQPWRTGRFQMVAVMTLSAVCGILIVRFLPNSLPLRTAVGLLCTGVLLTCSGVTLVPLISACILPVFLGTESWIYPLSVLALTSAAVLGRLAMERAGLRQPLTSGPTPPFSIRVRHWSLVMLALALFCLPATALKLPYLVAPPLLVTFAELCAPTSPLRRRPVIVWLTLAAAGCAGTAARMLNVAFGVPVTICALLAFAVLGLVFRGLDILLPPAAAAAILPMLLPAETLLYYPLLLTAGGALLIAVPCLYYALRRSEDTEPEVPLE